MSTIIKTNFGQIGFKETIIGARSECLGRGKHASKCNIKMEKDEDLQEMIQFTHSTYAR
jgi:hypothetical protein